MKIAVIMTDWSSNEYRTKHNLYGGVGYYRIVKPYQELAKRYKDISVDIYNKELSEQSKGKKPEVFWNEFVSKYDIIITKAIDNGQAAAMLKFFCERLGKKLIMDLDDNYFEVMPDQPAYQYYYPGSEKRCLFSAYLSMVDAVITSTVPLTRYYSEHFKKVFNINTPVYTFPNYNDINDWTFKSSKNKDKIVIGWAGSTTHDNDLELVMPAINRLMNEYPNVYLELMGGLTNETAPKVLKYFVNNDNHKRVNIKGGTSAWEGYPKKMSEQKWDIGIAPLLNTEFNRGKSHIKWMEYAMFKIPCVASKTYPYSENIKEDTGLLAIDCLDFYKKLKQLIDNKDLRKKIGENAYNYVKDNLQWSDNIDELYKIINKVYEL
jgi:glycosyltransferase involved in cell wall biosynthesis